MMASYIQTSSQSSIYECSVWLMATLMLDKSIASRLTDARYNIVAYFPYSVSYSTVNPETGETDLADILKETFDQ